LRSRIGRTFRVKQNWREEFALQGLSASVPALYSAISPTFGLSLQGQSSLRDTPIMKNVIKSGSVSLVILLVVLSGLALSQNFGPGGFRPDPALQAAAKAQTESATAQMHAYLNEIGYRLLADRAKRVAAIATKEQAIARRDDVRRRIVDLVGGVPVTEGPVNVKTFGSSQENGITIENIAYESCPNYWVTANVYVPASKGPFPAMIVAPGHGAGKASQYLWAANFASAGILVLAIDPMGQGERMQHWDEELGRSKLEGSGDHEHANQTALLIGHHIARYWFADGIRGVDYLIARPDVIADRIGTFGCSGGGTAAAYLAAMEPRIRVAAAASFLTSFKELLPGNGPQDAEQTLPSFIAEGLDFADWVELAAPRPYAIVAFERDFFPIGGAQWTFEEARRIYSLYGAERNLELIHGQGGHCNLGPVTNQLMTFLMAHLFPERAATKPFQRVRPNNFDKLTVTPTGQVTTSLGSPTVEAIARQDATKLMAKPYVIENQESLIDLRKRVQADVRQLAGVTADLSQSPKVTSTAFREGSNYKTESLKIESEPGIILPGALGIAGSGTAHPVVIWMDPAPPNVIAQGPEFIRLVRAGNMVVAFHPRDVLGEPQSGPEQLALGQYMPELLRAIVVSKTIVGMRVDDVVRLTNWICARNDVDRKRVSLYGKGGLGMVALHAAAVDPRITKVILENSLLSYRTALDAGLHKNLSEVLIPRVLTRYDTPQLMQAVFPRPIVLINPANAMGQELRSRLVEEALGAVLETDRALGRPDRIKRIHRGFGDSLQLD
jgi:cephalosporin-C deacetylase-like acetyl esterase